MIGMDTLSATYYCNRLPTVFDNVYVGADIVGRIGGDEFVVLLQNIHHVANAQQTSEKICECLSLPYEVDGKILNIGRQYRHRGISITWQ